MHDYTSGYIMCVHMPCFSHVQYMLNVYVQALGSVCRRAPRRPSRATPAVFRTARGHRVCVGLWKYFAICMPPRRIYSFLEYYMICA